MDIKKPYSHALFYPFLFVIISFVSLAMAQKNTITVKVGVVLDMDTHAGKMGFDCISMALSDFYATHDHYKTRLVLSIRDSNKTVVGAASAALDLLKNVEVQAIIGPFSSMQANFVIHLGDKAQVPIISFSATSPSLSSLRKEYFIRATLNDSSQVNAIASIIQSFGWREVVPIYVDDEFGEGIIPFLTDALEEINARIPYRSVIQPEATDDQIAAELYKLMSMQTRVFVLHMTKSLGSRLFKKAKELDMMTEEYVWIITDGMANELETIEPSVMEMMLGVIGVKPYTPRTKELDNFKIQYKKRVLQNNQKEDLNIYGLWAYDSAVALAFAAEKAIKSNASFQKTNTSMKSINLEDLGVSTDGPELIQALSSTTFIGLAENFQLVEGQLESPPYQIINMVGPGARVVGYWTKENGIVRELNFTNTNVYSTSKSNFGSIIWTGDKTAPPKGWVVSTNGKKIRIGVPVKDGFNEFVRVKWNADNTTEVEGYCTDVFDAVMEKVPYGVPYEYIPYADSYRNSSGSYDDLVYQVYLGNFDAVVGDVTIVANRSQYVDFTLPFTDSGVAMVVPIKDKMSKNAWIFLKPLTWKLWLTTFCSFVFIGFLVWILEHRINEDFRGPLSYQIGMIFWFAFSTMVFAHKERVISNLSRFVLIIWFLVVLILTQSYTASLTSMLTVQQLKPTITDINQLVKNKEYVGYQKGTFVLQLLLKMNFDESRLVPYNSLEEIDDLFSKGSGNGGISAAFDETPYMKLFIAHYCSKYTSVEPTYKADGFGFVFPIGSPLVHDVSRAILNVTEDKKMMDIERKWFGEKTECPDSRTLLSPNNIGLDSFWGLFLLVGIAAFSALTIYVIRFLREHWHLIDRYDPESTIRSKTVELFRKFDNKDLSSHTFKNITQRERCNECSQRTVYQSPSNFSLASPRTNGPPSPFSLSPTEQNTSFHLDQGSQVEHSMENSQSEASQIVNREIELANQNQNERITLTSGQTIH